jgi:hypothetical protein
MPRDFKRMLIGLLSGDIEDSEAVSTVDLWYRALRAGLEADPPLSVGYVKLVAEIGRAKENGSVGRGLTIVLPRGEGYDPMARSGEAPVIRIGSPRVPQLPAGQSEATAEDGLIDVLDSGNDRLELVEDVPTPCPDCRGRGWRQIDGVPKSCRMCEGSGTLPISP